MQPLVLAIEPDLRQAAIVKRIVREKVLADVTVVDSRDAALEAMRTHVPDVLLLSTLLSPRDEDELIAHLRTLEHAEHLQTHTIPQLASSIGGGDDDRPARGLLSSLWRRKGSGAAPSGCDPDLFADEIRTYLKRASEKKREAHDGAPMQPFAARAAAARPAAPAAPAAADPEAPAPVASSWESPFEWRPTVTTRAAEPAVSEVPEPVSAIPAAAALVGDPEPTFDTPEVFEAPPFVPEEAPRPKLALVVRHAREWWYEDAEPRLPLRQAETNAEDARAIFSLPDVAAVSYACGCRIRRVRLPAA
jgi:CheY-like chemotaxis protein